MIEWKDKSFYKKLKQESKSTYKYFYKHGTPGYRDDYKKLYLAIIKHEPEANFPLKEISYYDNLYKECIRDNPLLFYANNATFIIGGGGVTINFDYTDDMENLQHTYQIIFKELEDIRKKCENSSENDKIKIVHDYIATNVEYDMCSDLPIHYAQSVFLYKKAVCDGISKAAKILLDAVGIHSIVISGNATTPNNVASGGGRHAWNIVWTNGIPYHIDFTFDLNLTKATKTIHYDYYNLTDEQIKKDHTYAKTTKNNGIPTVAIHENDWFREHGLYFTKKKKLREHIKNCLISREKYIAFRLPFTKDSKATINDITELIKQELSLNILYNNSCSLSINEAQMTIYVYL